MTVPALARDRTTLTGRPANLLLPSPRLAPVQLRRPPRRRGAAARSPPGVVGPAQPSRFVSLLPLLTAPKGPPPGGLGERAVQSQGTGSSACWHPGVFPVQATGRGSY